MAQSLFINTKFIKENSVVNENVNDKIIRDSILSSQNKIEQSIGTGLYKEISSQINSTGDTLTAKNLILMTDYIIPCLKYYVIADLIPMNFLHIKNKNSIFYSAKKLRIFIFYVVFKKVFWC